jgi:hypothetical protein
MGHMQRTINGRTFQMEDVADDAIVLTFTNALRHIISFQLVMQRFAGNAQSSGGFALVAVRGF